MKCEKEPKTEISVIIPLYRGAKYCSRLLEMLEKNCLYQSLYQECSIEVIFVNDYPQEKITIQETSHHFEIKVLEQKKNMGIHAARVKGILQAQGEYITMLDQDDFVTEAWLYEQRKMLVSERADYCVCNGWESRFRIIGGEKTRLSKIGDLEYYLSVGNLIISPGQVLIRKNTIPTEWLTNIQSINGADDYLLWIMALKKKSKFVTYKECHYYHTPERTADSVSELKMIESIEETRDILEKTNYLEQREIELLNQRIDNLRERYTAFALCDSAQHFEKYIAPKSGIKFRNMFFIMYEWMRLKQKGIEIGSYLKKQKITRTAIYGMGYIGECLYQELVDSEVEVVFAIDRTAVDFKRELPIYRIEEELEPVDIIISTLAEDISENRKILKEKGQCRVVTFKELLSEMSN